VFEKISRFFESVLDFFSKPQTKSCAILIFLARDFHPSHIIYGIETAGTQNYNRAAQGNILSYYYLITGVAVIGLILNIILLKRTEK
jgi:hypothetical protein